MPERHFEIMGEIQYGGDLSFEDASRVEAVLRERVETLLAGFEPAYLDFRTTGDDIRFVSSVRAGRADDLRSVCYDLAAALDFGASGRLVAFGWGLGPVRLWTFSSGGVDETCLAG